MHQNRLRVARHRAGATIIELMVVMGIIGLLMALLIPAVQQSRESSRRISCRSNLKQIITAFHEHQETHGWFPGTTVEREHWEVRILPYLEQPKPVIAANGAQTGGPGPVPVYRCPSDFWATGRIAMFELSYYINAGHGWGLRDGFYMTHTAGPIYPRDVTDGLSNTAALSEKLAAPSQAESYSVPFTDDSYWHHRVVRKTASFIADYDSFADECEDRSLPATVAQISEASYNHIQTPNRNSCTNGDRNSPLATLHMAIAASSLHSGGVNMAFGDGAVRFVADGIDRKVWRALGTRNGGEAVSGDGF